MSCDSAEAVVARHVALQSVRRQNLSERVADQIVSYILANGLRAGDSLPGEREMCQHLGVSRTPLREALRALQLLRVIDVKHGKGAYVGQIDIRSVVHQMFPEPGEDREALLDLLEIREALEMTALRLALPRMTEQHLEMLGRLIASAEEKARAGQAPIDEDVRFHEVFFLASQNRVLISLAQALAQPLRAARERYFGSVGVDPELVRRHRCVYEAVAAGQHELALRYMAEHLQEAVQAMAAILVAPPPESMR